MHVDSGPLIPAVLASAALPGLYPPVRIDGRDLVDGGVVSNLPVDQALRMGARSVVVLDCGIFGLLPEAPRRLPETVAQVVAIMMRQQVVRDLPEVAREAPVLYLPGPFPLRTSPLEFRASPPSGTRRRRRHLTPLALRARYMRCRQLTLRCRLIPTKNSHWEWIGQGALP